MSTTQDLLQKLLVHKRAINFASTELKNQALSAMAEQLEQSTADILVANQADVAEAAKQISQVMLDRLILDKARILDMANGMRALISLPDPVGRILSQKQLPNGLTLTQKSQPFGLIGMIYESRPNVTADAVGLSIKSGNACILRSGKEAHRTSQAIVTALKKGLDLIDLSPEVIQLVEDKNRQSAIELMTAKGKIDLLLPRGGAGLIQSVVTHATVPVIETGTGICHLYVDEEADLDKGLKIAVNGKTSRPSVCNSLEVILVHEQVAADFLPKLEEVLQGKVELRADEVAAKYLKKYTLATANDFDTEFLDYILAVKVVSDVEMAICHIAEHSTGHSDAIITENHETANQFTREVDSAAVYVNASTRFTDGGEFGLGCELGISTQKMHARGPMGLEAMTTYKYIVEGNGHIRS